MNDQERHAAVRSAYDGHCGYCGVRETEAGSELEIDHFQPRSAGGGDDLDNLVYCCTACNRFKGDFWPAANERMTTKRLLHPKRDDLAQHLREEPDGRLAPISDTGAFHLERLRLNRPPLVALRSARNDAAALRQSLIDARAEQMRLSERITALDQEIRDLIAQIARLLES